VAPLAIRILVKTVASANHISEVQSASVQNTSPAKTVNKMWWSQTEEKGKLQST
jgi:hypothetical protein